MGETHCDLVHVAKKLTQTGGATSSNGPFEGRSNQFMCVIKTTSVA